MDREAWQATVHSVVKEWDMTLPLHAHTCMCRVHGAGTRRLASLSVLPFDVPNKLSLKAASCIFTSRVRQASASTLSSAASLIVITPCQIGKASNLSSRLSVRSNTSFSKFLTFCELLEKKIKIKPIFCIVISGGKL